MNDSSWMASFEMGRRPLNANEIRIIKGFAEQVSKEDQRQILCDLAELSVRSATEDGEVIAFEIEGYQRPPYSGQRDLDVDARVLDSDGAVIGIVLYTDQNGRLFELEYIRWDFQNIRDPQWHTFIATPHVDSSQREAED